MQLSYLGNLIYDKKIMFYCILIDNMVFTFSEQTSSQSVTPVLLTQKQNMRMSILRADLCMGNIVMLMKEDQFHSCKTTRNGNIIASNVLLVVLAV